jgi:hypothetical protein
VPKLFSIQTFHAHPRHMPRRATSSASLLTA